MGTTYTRNKAGERELTRDAKEGLIIYRINNHSTAITGQFEAQTYSTYICTHYSKWHASWMFTNLSAYRANQKTKGSMTVHDAVVGSEYCGTIPPHGLRDLASPEPDASGFTRAAFGRTLNRAELEYLEGVAADANDRREKRRAEAGGRVGRWF